MSERADKDFLTDIQEAIRRISKYTEGMTYPIFLADTKTQDAVIRNIEIIGEATKNLSGKIRKRYQNVPSGISGQKMEIHLNRQLSKNHTTSLSYIFLKILS